MGYCDRLYRPDSIIGYTGDIDNDPTVYFFAESRGLDGGVKTKHVKGVDQILFLNGHITQHHDDPTNIGRGLVTESYSYSIMNVGRQMQLDCGFTPDAINGPAAQETYHSGEAPPDNKRYYSTPDGFSDFHVSRNQFQPVSAKDYASLMKLANSIARFPRLKKMYGTRDDAYVEQL